MQATLTDTWGCGGSPGRQCQRKPAENDQPAPDDPGVADAQRDEMDEVVVKRKCQGEASQYKQSEPDFFHVHTPSRTRRRMYGTLHEQRERPT